MAYQKCPICKGDSSSGLTGATVSPHCKTCSNTGIISEITGLPPFTPEQETEYLSSKLYRSGQYIINNYPSKCLHKTIDTTLI